MLIPSIDFARGDMVLDDKFWQEVKSLVSLGIPLDEGIDAAKSSLGDKAAREAANQIIESLRKLRPGESLMRAAKGLIPDEVLRSLSDLPKAAGNSGPDLKLPWLEPLKWFTQGFEKERENLLNEVNSWLAKDGVPPAAKAEARPPEPRPEANDAKFSIRDANAGDAATIIEFNCALALESENKVLDIEKVTPGVKSLLADPHKGRYFLAETPPGDVIGQIMITSEWSDWRCGYFWWIQSVYVRPEYRRKGVYRGLHDHVAATARSSGDVWGIRLYCNVDNGQGRRTYEALGMLDAQYMVYELKL